VANIISDMWSFIGFPMTAIFMTLKCLNDPEWSDTLTLLILLCLRLSRLVSCLSCYVDLAYFRPDVDRNADSRQVFLQ